MREFRGYVYFVGNVEDGKVKIGITTDKDVGKRIGCLQTGCYFKLHLLALIECRDINPSIVEKDMHKAFSEYRLQGEWFNLDGALEYFISTIEKKDVKAIKYGRKEHGKAWNFSADVMSVKFDGSYRCPIKTAISGYSKKEDKDKTIKMLEIMLEHAKDQAAYFASLVDGYRSIANAFRNYDCDSELSLEEIRLKELRNRHWNTLCDERMGSYAEDHLENAKGILEEAADGMESSTIYLS